MLWAGLRHRPALLILELGQALLGGLLVAGVLVLAAEVAPGRRWVALGAGLIAAVHPTLVYAATHVQVALPAATWLVWTLALACRAGRTGRDRDALADRRAPRPVGPDRSDPRPRRAGRLLVGRPRLEGGARKVSEGDRGGQAPLGRGEMVSPCGHHGPDCGRWRDALDRAELPGPRRAGAGQEHVRLRLLAGELRAERGHRQGRPEGDR